MGDGGRFAALLENGFLPELGSPGVARRHESGPQQRPHRSQGEGGHDAAAIGDAPRGDHGHVDRVDDLGDEGHGADQTISQQEADIGG
jgi:hypothetical protein